MSNPDSWIPVLMVAMTLALHHLFVSSRQVWFGRVSTAFMVLYAVLALLDFPRAVWLVPLVISCVVIAVGTWLDLLSRRQH